MALVEIRVEVFAQLRGQGLMHVWVLAKFAKNLLLGYLKVLNDTRSEGPCREDCALNVGGANTIAWKLSGDLSGALGCHRQVCDNDTASDALVIDSGVGHTETALFEIADLSSLARCAFP